MDNIVNFADKKRSSLLMHFAITKSKLNRGANQRKGKYHKEPVTFRRKKLANCVKRGKLQGTKSRLVSISMLIG